MKGAGRGSPLRMYAPQERLRPLAGLSNGRHRRTRSEGDLREHVCRDMEAGE